MAEVLAPHGLRGEVKCRVVTDFPERFTRGTRLLLPDGEHRVEGARLADGFVFLRLEGVRDRAAAEALRGAEARVRRQDAVRLPEGRFFWHQVIGLRVEDATSGEVLGELVDILETGANQVYVVRGPRGEVLLPAIPDVIADIDPAAGRVRVTPLPGLLPPA